MLLLKKVKGLFHLRFYRQVKKRLRALKFPQMFSRESFLIDCSRMVRCGSWNIFVTSNPHGILRSVAGTISSRSATYIIWKPDYLKNGQNSSISFNCIRSISCLGKSHCWEQDKNPRLPHFEVVVTKSKTELTNQSPHTCLKNVRGPPLATLARCNRPRISRQALCAARYSLSPDYISESKVRLLLPCARQVWHCGLLVTNIFHEPHLTTLQQSIRNGSRENICGNFNSRSLFVTCR